MSLERRKPMPLVSIIVPVYKVEKYLRRCVDSLISQTLQDIEIILVDDGSPDCCGEICEQYATKDSRIKVIHKHNAGLGMARNSGLEIATSEYVAFVDSDDYVSHEMYEKMYTELMQFHADTCYCDGKHIYEKSGRTSDFIFLSKKNNYSGNEIRDIILTEMFGSLPPCSLDHDVSMSTCMVLYSNSIISKYNICFPSEKEFLSEDILFNIDYFSHVKNVAVVNKKYYYYIHHEESSSSLTSSYRSDRFQKSKALYFELLNKTENLNVLDIAKVRIDRTLIAYARVSIMSEVKFAGENGRKICLKNILAICKDETLQKVLKNYPIGKSPIKQRIFSYFMRLKLTYLLYLLVKIHMRFGEKL
jgi:glycosyltransferase involved in cell wall biosynthesis